MRKNWGWILICLLALLPLYDLYSMIEFNFSNPEYDMLLIEDYELSEELAMKTGWDVIPGMKYALKQTGEWAIRWMIAVLLLTPIRIVFKTKTNLYVRQAMGISCGVYAMIHTFLFIYSEGLIDMFSDWNLIAGFVAMTIIIPLTITSNRRSMKWLKKRWKNIHRLVFWAAIFAILHVLLLKEGWLTYTILFLLGLAIRYKPIRQRFEKRSFKLIPATA